MIEKVEIIEHLGNSDHNTICWKLICEIRQASVIKQHRQYARGDYEGMKGDLAEINWDEEFEGLAIDDLWLRFKDILDLLVGKYVPLVTGRRKKYPQWMTKAVKRARNYKVKKWKEYRSSGEYNDLVEYKIARNKADKEYRKAKRIFEERIADNVKTNPKGFYAYVRSKTTLKEVVGPLKDKDGRLLLEHGEMCNELNTFFASVFTKENLAESLPEVAEKKTKDDCCMMHITTAVVYNKLNS
jgi:hypothetical protein